MTIITEAELREMWQAGRGAIPTFPPGTRFTPAARDFLRIWQVDAQDLEAQPPLPVGVVSPRAQVAEVPPPVPAPPGPHGEAGAGQVQAEQPRIAVALPGTLTICAMCGQPVPQVPKTAVRLRFRSVLDTLYAQFLLVAALARRFNLPELASHLHTLSAYCREIADAERNERQVKPLEFMGLSEGELLERSRAPERHLGIPHLEPGPADHELLLWLNLLRCQTQQAELLAAEAFEQVSFPPGHADLQRALNQLASAVYYLALLVRAGKIKWKMPG
jgi:ethanolamine utilization cobalamin adenosyltransferase